MKTSEKLADQKFLTLFASCLTFQVAIIGHKGNFYFGVLQKTSSLVQTKFSVYRFWLEKT